MAQVYTAVTDQKSPFFALVYSTCYLFGTLRKYKIVEFNKCLERKRNT